MHRLLWLYFSILFVFSFWIFAVELGSHERLAPEEAVVEESGDSIGDKLGGGSQSQDSLMEEPDPQDPQQSALPDPEPAPQDAVPNGGKKLLNHQRSVDSEKFELPYLQLGYKTVYDAIRDCEMRFMQRIQLPLYTPSLAFTHQLGKCHMNFDDQDGLEINYLHEHIPAQRYMILLRPSKHRVEFPAARITETFTLPDETSALLSETPDAGYHVLSFEQDNWQYLLILPKHLGLPPEELVKAANSLQTYQVPASY